MNRAAVLIADRDTQLVVNTALECAGFDCQLYSASAPLLRAIRRDDHGLIVIDVDEAVQECGVLLDWRTNWLSPLVSLIAVGRADPRMIGAALDAGVDDFVTKPVRGPELLARVSAAERRRRPSRQSREMTLGGCRIDRGASAVVFGDTRIELTARELAVAQILFENAGHVVTRARLAADVWQSDETVAGRAIEQLIYQVRRKFRRCAGARLELRGVYGSGYRLDAASVPVDGAASSTTIFSVTSGSHTNEAVVPEGARNVESNLGA